MHKPPPSSVPDPHRRRLLLAGLAAAGGLPAGAAWSQPGFPTQSVRIVVPFGPGGFADITTRLMADKMGERLGQQVVVENRPGAGGVVAAQAVLLAPHDGHTLILFSNGTTIATTLLKLPYDPEGDFVPVSTLAYFDLLLLAGKEAPFRDLAALVAEGRRRQLTFGTISPGSTQHLSAELFRTVAKVQATVVPFKTSADVMTALQRGDVDLGFESYAALRGGIDGGILRPLACTGSARTAWLPQVPTVQGGRRRRLRRDRLERRLCAEGNARGRDRRAQRRHEGSARPARPAQALPRDGRRSAGRHAGGDGGGVRP